MFTAQNINTTSKYHQNSFLSYLLDKIGATLMGVKPAELLNISIKGSRKEQWEKSKKLLAMYKNIEILELREQGYRKLVLFYHYQALDKTLRQKPNLKFLISLGYPSNYKIDDYLGFLSNKIRKNEPFYEIGVFLGYPLKDVMGFLGYTSLKITGIKGWRFYGNKGLSEKTYDKHIKARIVIKKLLERETPEKILFFCENS